jgi:hypothetical protein
MSDFEATASLMVLHVWQDALSTISTLRIATFQT